MLGLFSERNQRKGSQCWDCGASTVRRHQARLLGSTSREEQDSVWLSRRCHHTACPITSIEHVRLDSGDIREEPPSSHPNVCRQWAHLNGTAVRTILPCKGNRDARAGTAAIRTTLASLNAGTLICLVEKFPGRPLTRGHVCWKLKDQSPVLLTPGSLFPGDLGYTHLLSKSQSCCLCF